MVRFKAIEGLRGLLAWAVVFSHLVYFADIYTQGFGAKISRLGTPSVLIFVIVSGFVIAHTLIERQEPYRAYLTRRFMRIFPLFAITSVIGYFACDVQMLTLARVAYSDNPDFDFVPLVTGIASSDHQYFWPHVLAHLTMLHGVFSDDVLPFSAYAFNMPAWSISLEWQFYVVAPFVLMIVMRRKYLIPAAVVLAVIQATFQVSLFGHFYQPSFLLAATTYFAIGIACRLIYPAVAAANVSALGISTLIVILMLPISSIPTAAVLVWMLFFLGFVAARGKGLESFYGQVHRMLWENRVILFLGSRSYATYLTHMLTITLCHYIWIELKPMATPLETFVALSIMTVPATIAVSELFYRSIERPGIALGSRIARWLSQSSISPTHGTGSAARASAVTSLD